VNKGTHTRYRGRHALLAALALAALGLLTSCGQGLPADTPAYFSVPLEIAGATVEEALIDTGGAFELVLREPYGLKLVGTAEVLTFGGVATVGVSQAVAYSAGGLDAQADFALVGPAVCDCNALGYKFFQTSGTVLGVDFGAHRATLTAAIPARGLQLRRMDPSATLPDFAGAWVEVEVAVGGQSAVIPAVLDTGAAHSVLQRGTLPTVPAWPRDWVRATVAHKQLGTVSASLYLFDTAGLPQLIIGLDLMRVWADEWYFEFTPAGGTVTVVIAAEDTADTASSY